VETEKRGALREEGLRGQTAAEFGLPGTGGELGSGTGVSEVRDSVPKRFVPGVPL
jgi:hypothetical protein